MTRDMTIAQFRRALARNGFESRGVILPYFRDTTGRCDVHFGAVLSAGGRIARRATIAHLIRCRKRRGRG